MRFSLAISFMRRTFSQNLKTTIMKPIKLITLALTPNNKNPHSKFYGLSVTLNEHVVTKEALIEAEFEEEEIDSYPELTARQHIWDEEVLAYNQQGIDCLIMSENEFKDLMNYIRNRF